MNIEHHKQTAFRPAVMAIQKFLKTQTFFNILSEINQRNLRVPDVWNRVMLGQNPVLSFSGVL